MRLFFLTILVIANFESYSQKESSDFVSISGGIGNKEGSIYGAYLHTWKLGKARKIEIGTGVRLTSYFSKGKYYTSAPAKLANTGDNIDSLFISRPQLNSFNLAILLAYHITPRITAGFNIDALGLSFGGNQNATYLTEGASLVASAKPTSFNILQVGNNDKGMLNSEFFIQYRILNKSSLKIAYQYLFTEYTTTTAVQQIPEANDRFRYKSGLLSVGISYLL